MPVTSRPSTRRRPDVGRSSPAMMRSSEVLPESVGPSSTVTELAGRLSSISSRYMAAPTRMPIFSSARVMSVPARARCAWVSPSQASRAATVAGATWRPRFDRRQRISCGRDRPFLAESDTRSPGCRDRRPDARPRSLHALGVAQQPGDPGAIGARVAARQIRRQPGPAAPGPSAGSPRNRHRECRRRASAAAWVQGGPLWGKCGFSFSSACSASLR